MKKAKKVLMAIPLFIIAISTKVLAIADSEISTMYGVPKDDYINTIPGNGVTALKVWDIISKFCIPFVLVIGLIIYFNKSKSSIKKKIVVSLLVILIVLVICFGINFLMKNV